MAESHSHGRHLLKAHIEALDRNNKPAQFRFNLIFFSLLSVLGSEIIVLFSRNKIGRNAVNFTKICIASALFIAAGIAISASIDSNYSREEIDEFQMTGALYLVSGLTIFLRGYWVKFFGVKDSDFEGISTCSPKKETTTSDIIKNFWEPVFFVIIGIFFCIGGVPGFGAGLIMCGGSVWFGLFVKGMIEDNIENRIDEMHHNEGEDEFAEVIMD